MATRVLVVNDTEELLESFRDLLEDEGYEVTLFSYAPLEIDEVRRAHPDIVILDLIFRGEKLGFELLQKMKLQRTLADIPVIVCSQPSTTSVKCRDISLHRAYLLSSSPSTLIHCSTPSNRL